MLSSFFCSFERCHFLSLAHSWSVEEGTACVASGFLTQCSLLLHSGMQCFRDTFLREVEGAGSLLSLEGFPVRPLLPSFALPSSLHETAPPLQVAPSPKGYLQPWELLNFLFSSDAQVARARMHWCPIYQCFHHSCWGPCLPHVLPSLGPHYPPPSQSP